jgi:hypothetical protein
MTVVGLDFIAPKCPRRKCGELLFRGGRGGSAKLGEKKAFTYTYDMNLRETEMKKFKKVRTCNM